MSIVNVCTRKKEGKKCPRNDPRNDPRNEPGQSSRDGAGLCSRHRTSPCRRITTTPPPAPAHVDHKKKKKKQEDVGTEVRSVAGVEKGQGRRRRSDHRCRCSARGAVITSGSGAHGSVRGGHRWWWSPRATWRSSTGGSWETGKCNNNPFDRRTGGTDGREGGGGGEREIERRDGRCRASRWGILLRIRQRPLLYCNVFECKFASECRR